MRWGEGRGAILTILVDMCGKIITIGLTDLSEYALLETH